MEKYLVAGLGNIGAEYASTRHNIGFMVLDAWAQASNAVFEPGRYGSVAQVSLKGRSVHLLKPSTYMNLSGNAVRYWLWKLDITPANLLVICDDLNLPFGTLRMRAKGSDGGHNGLKNINELVETENYARIRVGIGNNFPTGKQIDFVLGDFAPEEAEILPTIVSKAVQGAKDFVLAGVQIAMNSLNRKA